MIVDKLVMLLSVDWFGPYWSSIGIEAEDSTKSVVRQACRDIVHGILAGVDSYYLISFSAERQKITRSQLESLARERGVPDLLAVIKVWTSTSDEDVKAAWIYSGLTDDLTSGDIRPGDPKLDPVTADLVARFRTSYQQSSLEFVQISELSRTAWDKYIRNLTPEQPSALADDLAAMLRARSFEAFWKSLKLSLSPVQLNQLIVWYREMARSRQRREIAPPYVQLQN